jgi:C1A family cysteine protease
VTQSASQLKGCLASGRPFVFGFTVYDGFESDTVAQTGILQMPQSSEKVVGGHAVVGVGYDDSTQRFLVRNSWGTDWGQNGYFTMPYAYLTDDNLAADIWEIKLVAD